MTDRAIYPPEAAEHFKASAGKPYRPSNGDEGEWFMGLWCRDCHHDRNADKDNGKGCKLVVMMMAYNIGDKGYPEELQYGADGQPSCTKFVERGSVKTLRKKSPPNPKNAVKDMLK